MVFLYPGYAEDMERKSKAEKEKWEQWKLKRFGEGPFDPIVDTLIEEIILLHKHISQIDNRTMMLQTF